MKKAILASFLILLVIGLTGCASTGNTGTLVMHITDAPTELNIEKAEVTISEVQVHIADTANITDNSIEAGWVSITKEAKTYDLIALKDVKMLLGEANLTVGKYTQVRLTIDKAVVTINGTAHDLDVSSDKLKLVSGFDIVAGKTTSITLDFDAQKSIIETGNEKYKLSPTIKLIEE